MLKLKLKRLKSKKTKLKPTPKELGIFKKCQTKIKNSFKQNAKNNVLEARLQIMGTH